MASLLYALLCMYGIMFTLRYKLPGLEKLKSSSEFFATLLSCSFCTGFHAGYLTYMLLIPLYTWTIRDLAAYCFMGAAFCYILDTLMLKLESTIKSES